MAKQEQLSTYLNDHHAGASGAIDLADKAAANNEGTPFGSFLSELAKALEADMASLHRIWISSGCSRRRSSRRPAK